jgi:hypothetical protein
VVQNHWDECDDVVFRVLPLFVILFKLFFSELFGVLVFSKLLLALFILYYLQF